MCNGFHFLELGEKEYFILLRSGSDTAQAGMEQERPLFGAVSSPTGLLFARPWV